MADSATSWMALHSVPGLGPITFRRLLARFGTVERILNAEGPEREELARLAPEAVEAVARAGARIEWAEHLLDRLARSGGGVSRSIDPDYPPPLADLSNPPPLLYQLGQWRPEDARAVAIVGASSPSARGRDIAFGFGRRFAQAGLTVVSGYARGVDEAAHLGALDGGGRTVLCLPHGIRQFKLRTGWPPLPELVGRGALLSEQPPDSPWEAQAALARNRIIAALSRAVLVVETPTKGGTMNTFEHALALGRRTFVVRFENPPDSARGNSICQGRGATPLSRFRDAERVVETVNAGLAAGGG